MKLRAIIIVCLLCVTLIPVVGLAASRIGGIQVRGNGSVSEGTIKDVIGSRLGQVFRPEQIAKDIRILYGLGQFRDVRVEKSHGPRGLILTYVFELKSTIQAIEFEGNKKFDDDDLMELVEVEPFSAADPAKINRSIQKIQEKYLSKGYHLVSVRHRFKKMPDSEKKTLVFVIQEQQGIRVKRINFIGNKAFSDKELRKVIKTRQKTSFSWMSGSGKYQKEILERDLAFLTYHYLTNGYLKVQTRSPEVYLTRNKKWLIINFYVEEGDQYRINQVNVAGDILTTHEELIDKIKTRSGQIYSRKRIDQDLQTLSEMYGNEAYAFANIIPQTIPNDADLTADIIFQIRKGWKIKIEQINISGNTITRDKVIRRELELVENSYYHEGNLRRSRERIMALGYFEEVNFSTPRGSSDDSLILNIRVKEKPTGTFSIGAGFSSVESFILTASIAKDNFFGYGISGNFSLELSKRRQLYVLSFQDPYFLDTPWIFGLSSFRTVNLFEDFERASFGGNLTLGRRVFDSSRILLGYSVEDVEARNFNKIIPAPFEDDLNGFTSSFSLTLSRDTRNNRLYPSKGLYLNVANEFSGAGGDNRFFRVTGNARHYISPFWNILLKSNLMVGYIKSFDTGPVPLFERYFTGGINSLRGYQLRSVGPSVRVASSPSGGDSEFVIGGNKLLLMNAELEFPLAKQVGLKLVTFFDAGNAFAEDENYSLRDLRLNYGFGLRWNSPFGPMRFEWGIPINKKADEDPVVFNFSIGGFF